MRAYKNGFTLIELALVLIVIGLLTGGGAKLFSTLSKRAKVMETRDKLQLMSETIQGFVLNHNRLPKEDEWRDLFINHEDSWGKTIVYRVDPALTKKMQLCFTKKSSITLTKDGKQEQNLGFVLVSSGANRNMQTGLNDTSIVLTQRGRIEDFNSADFKRIEAFDDHIKSYSLHRLQLLAACKSEKLDIINQTLPTAYRNQPYRSHLFAQGGIPYEKSRYRWCMTNKSQKQLKLLGIQSSQAVAVCSQVVSNWTLSDVLDLQSRKIKAGSSSNYRLDFSVADSLGNKSQRSLILNVER